MGTRSGVLGTTDYLLVDRCVLEEVKERHQNLSVVYYDYKKAYDNVEHAWMDMVFGWLRFPREVLNLICALREKWKTKLVIKNGKDLLTSRLIQSKKGFLVDFCLREVPIGMELA